MSDELGRATLKQGAQQLMGDEGWYLPNFQTNLVIALHALSLLFGNFINTTAYHLSRYEPSYHSTKDLHGSLVRTSVNRSNALVNRPFKETWIQPYSCNSLHKCLKRSPR